MNPKSPESVTWGDLMKIERLITDATNVGRPPSEQ